MKNTLNVIYSFKYNTITAKVYWNLYIGIFLIILIVFNTHKLNSAVKNNIKYDKNTILT